MSLSQVRGQARALRLLRPLLASRRLPPALLFHGPDGVGKTLAAIELGKALNCLQPGSDGDAAECASCSTAAKGIDPDLKRVNASYQAGLREEEAERQRTIRVDTVRHLVKDMGMTSLSGRWKVAVLEDAERLEPEAANALLKSLEEPPQRTLWILVSARRERLLPTIVSRCHLVPFGSLSLAEAALALRQAGVPAEEAGRLAELAEGSPGRALALRRLGIPDPRDWFGDPLAPFRLADALPRELHLARPLVEAHLRVITAELGRRTREGTLRPLPSRGPIPRSTARALRELAKLSSFLRSNADPRLVLTLAALELERNQ